MHVGHELLSALEGRYEIEEEVSRSAMAVVYRARDLRHNRVVAIKVLPVEFSGDMESTRFLREIRLLAQLQHPHILPLFDSGDAGGTLYYVMPFVEGVSLRQRMRTPMTRDEIVGLISEVCDALSYAHRHNVLHRDVKPENILVTEGHALVVDFGIARALHLATAGHTTITGVALGTPAYMSPEQASADRELTEQSDIYSLGCVLYEMLVGQVPHAAHSSRGLLASRVTVPAKDVRELRPEIPEWLAAATMRALEMDAARRFPSAQAFALALRPPQGNDVLLWSRSRRRIAVGVVALLVAAAGLFAWRRSTPSSEEVDPSVILVLPFEASGGSPAASVDGAGIARMITDALSQWSGVHAADDMRVRDLIAEERGTRPSLDRALRLARRVGAGRLLWGSIRPDQNRTDVRASIFDVSRGGRTLASARRLLASGQDTLVSTQVDALTDELLTQVAGGTRDEALAGTRDLTALRTYLKGHAQLSAFHLDSASALFSEAARRDTAFARAYYWAAQATAWQLADNVTWEAPAAKAVALSRRLSSRERALAQALLDLSRARFPEACAAYDGLLARDSLDFEAWFGAGECRMRDRRVIRDARSPSGWRFRSSVHSAVTAYVRAFNLAPSFIEGLGTAAVARLEELLLATPNNVATGAPEGGAVQFAAYPALEDDTLQLTPWPADALFAGRPGTRPATYVAALDHNRELLRSLMERLARTHPQRAGAHASYAVALENVGALDTAGGAASALGEILRARALPHDALADLQYRATHLRVLVKLSRAAEAKALADSLLSAGSFPPRESARILASAAMLTGRLQQASQYLRASVDEKTWSTAGLIAFPVAIAEPSIELAVYAGAGAPARVVRPALDRTVRAINALAREDIAPSLRLALLDLPAALAYPATGVTPVHLERRTTSKYLDLQVALGHHDLRTAMAHLDSLTEETRADRPGDAGAEYVLIESLARLSLGDTTGALHGIDAWLTALPTTGRILMQEVTSIGALMRLWMLRASLASATGDRPTAVLFARRVVYLWAQADPILATDLAQMRAISGEPQ